MSNLSPNDPLYERPQTEETAKLTPQEQKLYKLYGRLPKKSEVLQSKLKDRKFFDSGDYAMSKATGHKEQVGSINPLKLPNIENVARINRNSISGVSATGLLSANQHKSNLENERKDVSEEAVLLEREVGIRGDSPQRNDERGQQAADRRVHHDPQQRADAQEDERRLELRLPLHLSQSVRKPYQCNSEPEKRSRFWERPFLAVPSEDELRKRPDGAKQ
ncbi:hypothetical protein KL911_000035 [Ogataea haglerorum]|uniref:uncharacterized protein n=1 Tax=Ogataea haglerorum TaxID=1937702 RepID=UPI001C8A9462|nr:uncharacterized protein KL911_000035 [Ogataea haglerorum]KAG7758898.1 hypothetical protein KL911_000035 [Ogataea haglerorum]